MSTNNPIWCSVHVFYNAAQLDFLLTEAVLPFTAKTMEEGLIADFFFIRYDEDGPHLRLRLKTTVAGNTESLARQTLSFFENFLKQHPSPPVTGQPAPYHNTVRVETYLPEVERYGGAFTMPAAELFFCSTSRLVAAIIAGQDLPLDTGSRLVLALRMHLLFVKNCGWRAEVAAEFFACVHLAWLPSLLTAAEKQEEESVRNNYFVHYTSLFEERFRQQPELQTYIYSWWHEPASDTDDVFSAWEQDVRNMHGVYCKCQSDLTLFDDGFRYNVECKHADKETQMLFVFYQSIIHMTNNRIGILNYDESYLAYILMEGLKNC